MANKEIINSSSEVQDGLGTSWFDAVYNLHTALARNVGLLEPATDPLGMIDDSNSSDKADQKNDDSDVRDEDSPLDPAAMVKQEMDVGPTMLHPPDIECTPSTPGPKNNSQIKSQHRRREKVVKTLTEENADKPKKCRIQHVCDICNKSFSRKSDLRKHILSPRTHISKKLSPTGERINQCEVCNKIFRQTGHLTTHMLIHTAVAREFRCNLCPKAFYTQVVLNSHRMSHSEHRPFKCDICEKAFKVKSALARHSLVHSGEKPYVCNVCGLAFTTRHWTQLHVRKVHNNEYIPYKPRVRNVKGRTTHPRDPAAPTDTLSHSAEPV